MFFKIIKLHKGNKKTKSRKSEKWSPLLKNKILDKSVKIRLFNDSATIYCLNDWKQLINNHYIKLTVQNPCFAEIFVNSCILEGLVVEIWFLNGLLHKIGRRLKHKQIRSIPKKKPWHREASEKQDLFFCQTNLKRYKTA